jgi:(heptosyl)LPS beta-1,4-glucosyltransferase
MDEADALAETNADGRERSERGGDASRSPVSVLLLARDETADVEALLPALGFAHEVVVVWDPRGERATRDAAERLGARVHEHAFAGFGPQRAFALTQCTQDWVLWLDADERLDAAARASIARAAAAGPGGPTHHRLTRATWFLGRRIRFCGWQGESVVRLFRRERASFDDAPVHERVRVEGPGPGFLKGVIEHDSYRTIADCTAKCVRYAAAGADKAFARGRRAGAFDVLVRPPLRFLRQYVIQLGFLDGVHGLVLCGFAATQVFLKYAELWRRSRAGSRA